MLAFKVFHAMSFILVLLYDISLGRQDISKIQKKNYSMVNKKASSKSWTGIKALGLLYLKREVALFALFYDAFPLSFLKTGLVFIQW